MTTNTSEKFFERYTGMPIPPIKENMREFNAGAITIGVEFRVLNDAVVASLGLTEIAASNEYPTLDDNGVSIHVFVNNDEGNFERLRFDCFQNDPHYHYLSIKNKFQDVIHIDKTVTGDPVTWALDLLRTRLPIMLGRADIDNPDSLVDSKRIEEILPLVTEAAFRARFGTDKSQVVELALKRGAHTWDTSTNRSWDKHSQL